MKGLKTVGLIFLIFVVAKELASAYSQIGWDVIFIIIPLILVVVGIVYFRKRNKKNKNEI
jgi:uncharacterized membrane protein